MTTFNKTLKITNSGEDQCINQRTQDNRHHHHHHFHHSNSGTTFNRIDTEEWARREEESRSHSRSAQFASFHQQWKIWPRGQITQRHAVCIKARAQYAHGVSFKNQSTSWRAVVFFSLVFSSPPRSAVCHEYLPLVLLFCCGLSYGTAHLRGMPRAVSVRFWADW